MKQAKVVAVARVTASGKNGTTHVLGVHGGLADTEALVQTFGIVPGQYEDNVRKINRVYRQAVLTGKNIDELDGDCMPRGAAPGSRTQRISGNTSVRLGSSKPTTCRGPPTATWTGRGAPRGMTSWRTGNSAE